MTVEVQQQPQELAGYHRHQDDLEIKLKLPAHHREDADLGDPAMMTEDTNSISSSDDADNSGALMVAPSADEVANKEEKKDNRVQFTTIEIREYPRCMGDNPAVTGGGPPITIGWEPIRTITLDLEEYEAALPTTSTPSVGKKDDKAATTSTRTHRTPTEFQLPATLRYEIIYTESLEKYTKQQIQDCLDEVQRHKWNRQSSFALQDLEHIQIVVESCIRKFKRLKQKIGSSSSKQKKTTKGQGKYRKGGKENKNKKCLYP